MNTTAHDKNENRTKIETADLPIVSQAGSDRVRMSLLGLCCSKSNSFADWKMTEQYLHGSSRALLSLPNEETILLTGKSNLSSSNVFSNALILHAVATEFDF